MNMMINVTPVTDCMVTECAYNANKACHARAITIGHGAHSMCDTFMNASMHVSASSPTGGVGACKVSDCIHNQELECQAPGIHVGHGEDMADCLTFTAH